MRSTALSKVTSGAIGSLKSNGALSTHCLSGTSGNTRSARDVKRFKNANQLESYLGLTPGENTTGFKQRRTRITKAVQPRLRHALGQAALVFRRLRPADPMVLWAQKRAKHASLNALYLRARRKQPNKRALRRRRRKACRAQRPFCRPLESPSRRQALRDGSRAD